MELDGFPDVKDVVSDQLKFKTKLAIGKDAYKTLRAIKKLDDLLKVGGGMVGGAAAAGSATVATTFFAPAGLMGLLGIGTAVTPIGWVIAAAVLSGGTVIGIRRFIVDVTDERVMEIPVFTNTPLNILAVSLFGLMANLALGVAAADGQITEDERKWIKDYFKNEWGYNASFLDSGLQLIESNLKESSIKEIAQNLAKFCKENRDCNYSAMTRGLIGFLQGVMEADGKIDEKEEAAIGEVENIFRDAGKYFHFPEKEKILKTVGELSESAKLKANDLKDSASATFRSIANKAGEVNNSIKDASQTIRNSETIATAVETFKGTKDSIAKGVCKIKSTIGK